MSGGRADLLGPLLDTWPAAETRPCGAFTLRRSDGGGSRVTAATRRGGAVPDGDRIAAAAAAMRLWGQPALFLVPAGDDGFDDALESAGLVRRDPTIFHAAPLAPLLEIETPRLATFEIWPPLAILDEIWQAGGVGPDRRAVMHRCRAPRTALLGRQGDRPAGAAFVAAAGEVAMIHALEVVATQRRRGLARRLVGRAAQWARRQGCNRLAVAVTTANVPARALYAGLGMAEQAGYHYRADAGPAA